MTPRQAAVLIAGAKARAIPVKSYVDARLRTDHLLSGCSWEELAALVIVLAEAADRRVLRQIADTGGDGGLPEVGDRARALRKAHAEVARLQRAGEPIPLYLRQMERVYRREAKRRLCAARKPWAA